MRITRLRSISLLTALTVGLAACSSAAPEVVTATATVDGSIHAPPPTSEGVASSSVLDPATSSSSTAPTFTPSSRTSPTNSTKTPTSPTSTDTVPKVRSGPVRVTDADVAQARKLVAAMTVRQRAQSVVMPTATQVPTSGPLGYGGIILMGARGVLDGTREGTPQQVADLVTRLQGQAGQVPMLIGIDQEYGDVTRLVNGFTPFPGAAVLGSMTDPATAGMVAAAAGREMRAVGITVDFAPVADVRPGFGQSAIGDRAYDSDPARVGRFVAAVVDGLQRSGVAATIKHFPGIGGLAQDTHVELPVLPASCARWSQNEAVPMRAGGSALLAMTGHVHFPAAGAAVYPSSISHRVVTDLLRGKGFGECVGIGFTGVTITDSMQMAPIANHYSSGEAAWRALAAGQDLVLMPVDPKAAAQGIEQAVTTAKLRPDRLTEAATRVMALRLATAATKRPPMSVIRSAEHLSLSRQAGG